MKKLSLFLALMLLFSSIGLTAFAQEATASPRFSSYDEVNEAITVIPATDSQAELGYLKGITAILEVDGLQFKDLNGNGIDDEIPLLQPQIIEPVQELKCKYLGNHNPRLHTDEILIALSICAATNPTADLAMRQLSKLRGCEAHSSVILSGVDVATFRKLGVNLTCEPRYQTKKLFHK